jgi:hypothetical protein
MCRQAVREHVIGATAVPTRRAQVADAWAYLIVF